MFQHIFRMKKFATYGVVGLEVYTNTRLASGNGWVARPQYERATLNIVAF